MKVPQKILKFINNYAGLIVGGLVIFYNLFFGLIIAWKYFNFGYDAMDLAIINNVFFNSSLGHWFASSIHPPTYLGDHFSPIIFLILPVYKLFPQSLTLVFLQTFILSACSWPIYLIAKKVLNQPLALLFVLAWLINPFVQNVNLFEVSFLPYAIFFIFFAFYFYQKERFWLFILFCFLALLVREDVSLVIVAFGPLAFLDKKKIKWQVWPIVISILYFILAIKISGYFSLSGSYKFLLYYAWLGTSIQEILKNIILSPWRLLPQIFSFGTILVFFSLILPLAFLPLLKSKYLIFSLLVFLQLALGTAWYWLAIVLYTQYACLLLPGIFLAAIFGTKELLETNILERRHLNFLMYDKNLLTIMVLATVIYGSIGFGPVAGTLVKIFKNQNTEKIIYQEALAQIPNNASIAATYKLMTPLSNRENIYSFNYIFLNKQQFLVKDYTLPENTEYLVIDYSDFPVYLIQYGITNTFKKEYLAALNQWPNNLKDFGLIWQKGTVSIYKKGASNSYDLVKLAPPVKPENSLDIKIDDNITFLGFTKLDNQYQFFWQSKKTLEKNYLLNFLVKDKKNKTVYEKVYPFAYFLIYNQPNQELNFQTNYWFFPTKKIAGGEYNLKLQVVEMLKGRMDVSPWRSTSDLIFDKNILGQEIDLGKISF